MPDDNPPKKQIKLERTYRTSAEKVWELWTTTSGIESWWGPDGFEVNVDKLDLRPGGEMRYTMTAVDPDQVRFMQQAGMPLATEVSITYTEVEPPRRLGYTSLTDFVPDVAPYEVRTVVEIHADGGEVRMILTFDAMHDGEWTERATMGHESQLAKLDKLLG
jgi:uncharacterized protein YndB with AHSA1/START domain